MLGQLINLMQIMEIDVFAIIYRMFPLLSATAATSL